MENLTAALTLAGVGILGVFAVLAGMYGMIRLLQKLFPAKDDSE